MNRLAVRIAVVIAIGVCAVAVFAQISVVTFKDGRPPLVGTVVPGEDGIRVTTEEGQVVPVPMEQVESITVRVSPREEYEKRLLALKSDDPAGHYDLAVWCQQAGLLQQARVHLETVLRLNPDHVNARLRLPLVEQALAQAQPPARPEHTTRPATPAPPAGGLAMSQEDIYVLRLAELRSRDRVRIDFRNDVLRRFLDRVRGHGRFAEPGYEAQFLAKPPVEKAVEILLALPRDKDLHADILIKTNPAFMAAFKTRIWPVIAGHCGSLQCHGGAQAGRLRLNSSPTTADEQFYANFYVLDTFESRDGRLINRNLPPQSLLLLYGLPEEISRAHHPGGPVPLFQGTADPRYRMMDEWIRSLLNPHPTYEVSFKAPGEPADAVPAYFAPEAAPNTQEDSYSPGGP